MTMSKCTKNLATILDGRGFSKDAFASNLLHNITTSRKLQDEAKGLFLVKIIFELYNIFVIDHFKNFGV